MNTGENEASSHFTFIKKFGLFGFLFFLGKGLLWLIVPVVVAYFGLNIN